MADQATPSQRVVGSTPTRRTKFRRSQPCGPAVRTLSRDQSTGLVSGNLERGPPDVGATGRDELPGEAARHCGPLVSHAPLHGAGARSSRWVERARRLACRRAPNGVDPVAPLTPDQEAMHGALSPAAPLWPSLASHDDRRLWKPDSGAGTAAHRRPPGRSRPPADPIKRSNSLETVARHRRLEPNYSERSGPSPT